MRVLGRLFCCDRALAAQVWSCASSSALISVALAVLWRLISAVQCSASWTRRGWADCGRSSIASVQPGEPAVVAAGTATSVEEPRRHGILLFYQYVQVSNVSAAVAKLKQVCYGLELSGRVRVSFEGFNGNLSGPWDRCQAFAIEACTCLAELANTDFKLAPCKPEELFRGLKVWESQEVCGLFAAAGEGRAIAAKNLANAQCGRHLSPIEWHEALKTGSDDMVLFDCRNLYETRIGRFAVPGSNIAWVDPSTRFFKELPDYFERNENLQQLHGKRVMMYCTGGVRCERASALLKQRLAGTSTEVFQLEGGIQRYMERFPEGGFFEGTMHVFDRRGCVGPTGNVDDADANSRSETLGQCALCKEPWNTYQAKWRCSTCDMPFLACSRCQGNNASRATVLCELCCPTALGQDQMMPHAVIRYAARNSSADRKGSWTSRDALAQSRADRAVQQLEFATSCRWDSTAVLALLDELKDLSGNRQVRSNLCGENAQGALNLRSLFNTAVLQDESAASLCIEIMELWLREQILRQRLHLCARPDEMALQFLQLPTAPEVGVCAGLRIFHRLTEVREARPLLELNLSVWLEIVNLRAIFTNSVRAQTEACIAARGLAEHFRLHVASLEGRKLFDSVTGAIDARSSPELAASGLAALYALRQGVWVAEVPAIVQTAAKAMRMFESPLVQRWGCALLFHAALLDAGCPAFAEVSVASLALKAKSSPGASPWVEKLLSVLEHGVP